LLDQIANGSMDLAQECPKSLIALSCLHATWERIKTQTVQSAAARFPIVQPLDPRPSSDVGKALIAAHFSRAYERVGFTPPYPTWPIKPSAFQDAFNYTPRRLIELSEAHARKCRRAFGAWVAKTSPRPYFRACAARARVLCEQTVAGDDGANVWALSMT
jgi:hypothetical protein